MMRISIALATAATLLAGCASDTTNYPSLARRDVERVATPPSPSPTPASPGPAAPDPALAAKVADLVDRVREAHRRFGAVQERTERAVAAGAGTSPGSEAWAVASVALASLESARSEAMLALADLDGLYADAQVSGGAPPNLAAARESASALIGEEDRVLATLRGRLGS